jgi:Tfp pilus assembly protein PilF
MNHWFVERAALLSRTFVVAFPLVLAGCSSPEQRAEAHYRSGNELVEKGEFVRAGLEFRNAIKYNEKMASAWFGLALVEEKSGNVKAVAGALQRVVELDPQQVDAKVKLATILLAFGDTDQALVHANAANELRKNDSAILALRAAVLFRLNDREGAKAEAERSLAVNPDNPDAHGILAAVELQNENNAGAMQFIDRGLKADPKNLGLLLFKSRLYEVAKDDTNLEANIRRTIEAQPELLELRKGLIAFLVSRKRLADAEVEIRNLAAAKPNDTELAMGLVSFILEQRGAAAGRAELDRLLAAQPEVGAFKLASAKLDYSNGDFDAAKKTLDAIVGKAEPVEDVKNAKIILASMYSDKKDFVQANAIIDNVLSGDAKNVEALTLKANIKLENGKLDDAIQDARDALNQAPQSVPLHLLLARAYERQGSSDLAAERYAEAAKLSKFNPGITLDYAKFLAARGKSAQAESVLGEALAANNGNVVLMSAMARLKLAKGEWEEAQKLAEDIKASGDTTGAADQILSTSLLGQKKYSEVTSAVESSSAAIPQAAKPLATVVQAYLQAGKLDEAEKFLGAVLQANGKNAEAYALLGGVKSVASKPDEAEAAFRKAIEVQPQNAVGYRALAGHQMATGKRDIAETTLRDARTRIPGDASLALTLAGLYERTNRIDEAIAVYEEQYKATPEALVIVNNLGSLLADFRTDQASLDRAHEITKRLEDIAVPHFKDTLGWIAYRRGDYQAALSLLKDASVQMPNQPLTRYHLAMTFLALKRNKDAAEHFNAALALLKDGDPLRSQVVAGLDSAKIQQ